MFKRKLDWFILGGYLLGVLASLLIRKSLVLPRDWLAVLGLTAGGFLGWWLVWLDKLAYVYILHPEAQISQYVNYYVKKKKLKEAWGLLKKRGEEMGKLTTRSVMFQVAWTGLAFFSLTSVGSLFGRMLVMALGLRILAEEWLDYGRNKEGLKKKLFWQIKREISDEELRWYLYISSGLFAWLSWILV